MDAKQITILAGAAILIMGAFLIFTSNGEGHGQNNANFPDGLFFLCADAGCKHGFNMTVDAFSEFQKEHYGEKPSCPKCGTKDAVRADRCKKCEKYFVMGRDSTVCPHCGHDGSK